MILIQLTLKSHSSFHKNTCSDSGANANRSGMASITGQYMRKFAEIIQRIKDHELQQGKHVFFLCENVEAMKDVDVMKFEHQFGISRLNLDALQLSPVKRARSYFTNVSAACSTFSQMFYFSDPYLHPFPSFLKIPVNELPTWNSALSQSSTVNVLAGGWMDPAQLYCHIHNEPGYSKANTFMASEGA